MGVSGMCVLLHWFSYAVNNMLPAYYHLKLYVGSARQSISSCSSYIVLILRIYSLE